MTLRCTKCHRPLTDPDSQKAGMGRKCRGGSKVSVTGYRPRRTVAAPEQLELPLEAEFELSAS